MSFFAEPRAIQVVFFPLMTHLIRKIWRNKRNCMKLWLNGFRLNAHKRYYETLKRVTQDRGSCPRFYSKSVSAGKCLFIYENNFNSARV